jgi:hypothetical protein
MNRQYVLGLSQGTVTARKVQIGGGGTRSNDLTTRILPDNLGGRKSKADADEYCEEDGGQRWSHGLNSARRAGCPFSAREQLGGTRPPPNQKRLSSGD